MKIINKIISNTNGLGSYFGLIIEILFVTDIWIFIYTTFLIIQRLFVIPNPSTDFLMLGVYPEPLEIPLYLGLTTILVFGIFYFHKYAKRLTSPSNLFIKIPSFIILLSYFLLSLGSYPLKGEVAPYLNFESAAFTNLGVLIYFIFVIFVLLEICIINKMVSHKYKKIVIFIITTLIIALLTFSPRFPISGIDYSLFYGPIWEIAHGNTIFTQVTSIYGFLSILLFAFFLKLKLFSLSTLPVIIWLLFVIEYLLCFYLILKQSKSYAFALLGTLSIITINYLTFRVTRIEHPQSGPMRVFLPIFLIFFIDKYKKIESYWFTFAIAVATYWIVDTGIEILMAYLLTIFFLFLMKNIRLKSVIKIIVALFLNLVLIFIFLNAVHLFFGYKLINLLLIFTKVSQYAKVGFGMIPIDVKNYFWLTLLVYFSTIIYVTRNEKIKKESFGSLLFFSANLMLFISIYFVGRSHPSELYTISIFTLLTFFLLLGKFYSNIHKNKYKFIFMIVLFLLFIFYPTISRKEAFAKLINEKIKKLRQGNALKPELLELLEQKYEEEIILIKQNIPENKTLIISGDDTYLYYLVNKSSLIFDNSLEGILTQKDLDHSLSGINKSCPKIIAGECKLFKNCPEPELFSKGAFFIQPLILSKLESTCQVKYVPTHCTDQFCIAESKRI